MAYDLTVGRARDPLIAITVFAAIAILTTVLRLRARTSRDAEFAVDDYLMLAALFFLFVSIGIQFACVIAGGVGRHIEDVHVLDVVKTLKSPTVILPFEALYGITLCLIKTSIVSFYLRIFGTARNFRISAYVAIGILIAWALSVVLETFLLCRPLAFNWDSTINGVCGDRNTVYVSAGALNVVTDFMVMSLPVSTYSVITTCNEEEIGTSNHVFPGNIVSLPSMPLSLTINKALTICSITIISIIRIKSLQVISFTDPTFTLPMGLFWTTLEPCLCIINANLPMTRTYLATRFPTVFGSTKDRTYATGDTGRMRTQAGAYGSKGSRNTFEMLADPRDTIASRSDSKGFKSGTKNFISGGGSEVDSNSIESQRELTSMSRKNQIMVGTTVDVERL